MFSKRLAFLADRLRGIDPASAHRQRDNAQLDAWQNRAWQTLKREGLMVVRRREQVHISGHPLFPKLVGTVTRNRDQEGDFSIHLSICDLSLVTEIVGPDRDRYKYIWRIVTQKAVQESRKRLLDNGPHRHKTKKALTQDQKIGG